jgi:hypothetical protein
MWVTVSSVGEVQSDTYEYDVCLSFAGEQREYVRQVAEVLQERGVKIFFDEYEEADLWGKDLYEHLATVYGQNARYCILFASKEYADKVWTSHERANAQARALQNKGEYLLPARFDNTEIPGLRPTIAYIDLSKKTPTQLAELFIMKLHANATPSERLADLISSRFDAEWEGDQRLFESVRHEPGFEAFRNALRRAGELRITSSRGLRVPIEPTDAYLRVADPDGWSDKSSLDLIIETSDSTTLAVCQWFEGISAVDVTLNIAKELRQTSYWGGEQNYSPESIFAGFSDALLFGLHMVRRGQLGVYGRMFQVVNDWILTEWWLVDKNHRYQVAYNRFNETDWIPHVTEKTWVIAGDFVLAFETAFALIERGIFDGRLPDPDKRR